MPPRPVVALVVAFWLATTAWLVYREWWPWLAAEGPPPFVIYPVDEAAPQVASWAVYSDGREMGVARSRMEPQRDGTFDLVTELRDFEVPIPGAGASLKLAKLDHTQTINRSGELTKSKTLLEFDVGARGFFRADVQLDSVVKGEELHSRVRVWSSLFQPVEQELDPVRLASRQLASPLMPLTRFRGLTVGRTWKINLRDPLNEALMAWIKQAAQQLPAGVKDMAALLTRLPDDGPKVMLARVLPEKQSLVFERQERPCLIVEYTAPGLSARTWVTADQHADVLRQEMEGMGLRLTFERDDTTKALRR